MVIIGVAGICLYADMAGRVAAVSGRATFEIIRERLGPRVGLANLGASFLINLLTLTAEIGGIALALQLAAGVGPGLWIPVALFGVWIVIWRTKFSIMENVAGMLGLTLIVFVVALFLLKPDWGQLGSGAAQPWAAASDSPVSYWYFAVALFGAAMTPYEVFFFSSGAVEEKWTSKDLATERANVFVGLPARRHPLALDRRVRRRRAAAAGDRGDEPVAGRAAGRAGGRAARARVRHRRASWPRRSALRSRRRCRAATPWRSSSAGAGASSAGPPRPPGSTSR